MTRRRELLALRRHRGKAVRRRCERLGTSAADARAGCGAAVRAWIPALAVWVLALGDAPAVAAPDPPTKGFQVSPSLAWQQGPHRVDVALGLRSRIEWWDAFGSETDAYVGTRARARLQYRHGDRFALAAELQLLHLDGMNRDGTGALALYRNANDGRDHASATDLRQLLAEWRPTATSWLRVGRQDLKLGAEALAEEPDWRYLKASRLGERLLGTVGWSHAERAFDGVDAGVQIGGHLLHAFAAQPTTGVFAIDDAYEPLRELRIGGASWTVTRGTWLEGTELGLFALVHDDERDPADGGLAGGEVEVYTLGGHWLGVYPLGPGVVDLVLWAAGQLGDFAGLDHRAAAGIVELGYRLPELPAKPWLRAGVNAASGDGTAGDGDHHTFFNGLPTNHLYYGFADQLAFQNLVNPFLQLRLAPHPWLTIDAFVHGFWLASRDDARYAGTGAFDRNVFGFAAQASGAQRDVGVEYDVVVSVTPQRNVTIEGGFAWLDGGDVFREARDRDVMFGYLSLALRY